MNGQWIGQYTGSDSGSIIVNLDDMGDHYEGIAFLTSTDKKLPAVAVGLKTENKTKIFKLKTPMILPIDPRTGLMTVWDNVKQLYPNITFSKEAEVSGDWNEQRLVLSWSTDQGVTGSATIPRSKAGKKSEQKSRVFDWNRYKKHVSGLESRRYLFRGQEKPWRLRTKFHRSGRAELSRFLNQDIQTLHKHLSARTKHIFNLLIPDELGAFFNLVQHHGYPTPLLDWTYSPYVAVFFAFWRISNLNALKGTTDQNVRIFVFDQKQWRQDFNQPLVLNAISPYFSIMEPLAIDNERMILQQAVSSVTNIDDIENYIKSKESPKKKYLYIIDLPVGERKKVIRELDCMGITAGSLFPGLDGACEELKERFFEV